MKPAFFRHCRIIPLLFFCLLAAAFWPPAAAAAGKGKNLWDSRLSYRLDRHYGQVAANGPWIRMYNDAGCGSATSHYLIPGDWAVAYFDKSGFTGLLTYPITVQITGGPDKGLNYSQHYIRKSALRHIVSGAGAFSGTNWNTAAWWNHLPSSIGYTGKYPGNGETVWVGNNTGGFKVVAVADYKYVLYSGQGTRVMNGVVSQYCYYDTLHTDLVNANYRWNKTSRRWSADGLRQGRNTVCFAGMDASGNYATGQRALCWDTCGPFIDTTLPTGWMNLQTFRGAQTYAVSSQDDRSATTDVSGLNVNSLIWTLDGKASGYLNLVPGNASPSPDSSGSYTGYRAVRSLMQSLGVQDSGIGGQGAHTVQISLMDRAGNVSRISRTVGIDTVAPACTASSSAGDWHTEAKPVTLSFADATSGVATRRYAWSQGTAAGRTIPALRTPRRPAGSGTCTGRRRTKPGIRAPAGSARTAKTPACRSKLCLRTPPT